MPVSAVATQVQELRLLRILFSFSYTGERRMSCRRMATQVWMRCGTLVERYSPFGFGNYKNPQVETFPSLFKFGRPVILDSSDERRLVPVQSSETGPSVY